MTTLGGKNVKTRDTRRGMGKKFGGRGAPQKIRESSVAVRADWASIEEMDFPRLMKLSLPNIKEGEDIVTCGTLEYYDKIYDRINVKNEKSLQKIDRIVHTVTTTDDPIIRRLSKVVGNVFATDAILATIMCSTRSNYSWDIVIEKYGEFAVAYKIYLISKSTKIRYLKRRHKVRHFKKFKLEAEFRFKDLKLDTSKSRVFCFDFDTLRSLPFGLKFYIPKFQAFLLKVQHFQKSGVRSKILLLGLQVQHSK